MHRLLIVGAAGLAALALSSSAGAWSWPAEGDVLRPFALGGDAYAAGQHRGIDVAGPEGSSVRAPAAGTVSFAGSLPTYGKGITITTPDGYAVTLVHLGSIGVAKGDAVIEGGPIGTMGWSGDPEHTVASVHLGVRVGESGGGVPRPARPPAAAARTTGSGVPAGSRTGAVRRTRTGSRRSDADAGVVVSTCGPAGSNRSVVPGARRLAARSVVRGTDDRDERERAGRRGDTRPLLGRSGRDGGPGRAERRRRLRGGARARGAVPSRPRHPGRHPGPSVADIVGVRRAGGRVPGRRARRQRDVLAEHPTDSGRGDGRG